MMDEKKRTKKKKKQKTRKEIVFSLGYNVELYRCVIE